MHQGNRRGRAVGMVGSAAALALLGALGLSGVSASPTSLRQTTAKAIVNAPPDATWYGQMNAKTVCGVLPGCVEATAVRGGYRLTLQGEIDGLGQITQDVNAKVVKKKPPRLMRLKLTSQSGLGSLNSTVDITLAKKGTQKSTVAVTVRKASASGALGNIMLPFLAARLQPGLTAYASDLNRQVQAANLGVNASVRKTKRHVVRILVYPVNPMVQAQVTAKGKARVTTSKGKTLCTAKIRTSKGKCSYRKGPKKPRVIVTGAMSNGFQVWHATTGKAAK